MLQWPSDVRLLTASALPEVLTATRLVGIHCWASWNAHDYEFARELGTLSQGAACGMDLYAMDAEEGPNALLLVEWGVLNVPAFVIFQRGRRLRTFYQGRESVRELRQRIEHWLRETGY
jgi:thioredoxin-like negative regulator of GroEL